MIRDLLLPALLNIIKEFMYKEEMVARAIELNTQESSCVLPLVNNMTKLASHVPGGSSPISYLARSEQLSEESHSSFSQKLFPQ